MTSVSLAQTQPVRAVPDAYARGVDEICAILDTSTEGLSTASARGRLAQVGPNLIEATAAEPAWRRFLRHFDDILIYILLVAAALKLAMGEWIDFWVILAVAVINAVIGFVQEGRAETALAGIRQMLSAEAQVLRDGSWVKVGAEELVPGDVVRVGAGAKVPADMRLLEASNLRVAEAALTGESEPSPKDVAQVPLGTDIGDRSSMLFSSALVSAGQGVGVVTATGSQAEIGRITTMLSEIDTLDTPMTRQMNGFAKKLSLVIGVSAVVLVLVGRLLHGMPTNELISAVIGFAVAAIPEGLPALVTITWPWVCSRWPNAMRSSASCRRWRRWARSLGSVPTRPAPSPPTRSWWSASGWGATSSASPAPALKFRGVWKWAARSCRRRNTPAPSWIYS